MPIESIVSCSSVGLANIFISNFSLDVSITGVFVDGMPVNYSGGTNFPIFSGSNGDFTTGQIGVGKVISVSYSTFISGQNIYVYDSALTGTCENTGPGGSSFSVFGAFISSDNDVSIYASDGMCF